MARCDYVYVVMLPDNPIPIGGFTVKRELHIDAERFGWYRKHATVTRIRGGSRSVITGPLTETY